MTVTITADDVFRWIGYIACSVLCVGAIVFVWVAWSVLHMDTMTPWEEWRWNRKARRAKKEKVGQ